MQHHRVGLARELETEGIDRSARDALLGAVEAFGCGEAEAPAQLTARERAMLDYALLLTRAPASVTRSALEPMREAGLDDREILETNQVAAYFAYVNRVVDGLGVELEPYFAKAPL